MGFKDNIDVNTRYSVLFNISNHIFISALDYKNIFTIETIIFDIKVLIDIEL